MKKSYYLIVLALILGLVLTGCSLLSNISQVPATDQSGITYLTKAMLSPDDLVGLWSFDEGMGSTANDISGNNNDGTLMGGTSWTSGKFGNALSFDGSNGYVLVADDATFEFGTSDFTVEAWINVRESALVSNREYGVVNKNSYFQGTPGWGIEVSTWGPDGDFGVICYITNQTSWVSTKYLSVRISSMTADVWHHIAQVRTGTTLRLYFDGELVGTKTHGEIGGNVNNSQPVIIGDHSWGPNFPGLIDEVRIWNTALTADQLNLYDDFSGLLAPYKGQDKAFKRGSSIPLRWQYTNDLLVAVNSSTANPSIKIKPVEEPNGEPIDGTLIVANDPGSSGYHYDSETNTWHFNWQTEGYGAGDYNIYIINDWTGQTFGPCTIKLR